MGTHWYHKVEPRRVLSEEGLRLGATSIRGAWLWTLVEMWETGVASIRRPLADWARAWNESEERTDALIRELQSRRICHVRVSPTGVRLTSRFLSKKVSALERDKLRKKTERASKKRRPRGGVLVTSNPNSNSKSKETTQEKQRVSPAKNDAPLKLSEWTITFCRHWTTTRGARVSQVFREHINPFFSTAKSDQKLRFACWRIEQGGYPATMEPWHLCKKLVSDWRDFWDHRDTRDKEFKAWSGEVGDVVSELAGAIGDRTAEGTSDRTRR